MALLHFVTVMTNPVMLALTVVSVAALAAVMERAWSLFKTPLGSALEGELIQMASTDAPSAPRGRYPLERLYAKWQASAGHRGHVEQAVSIEEANLEANLWILDCAASVAPLLGILGTLTGISQSFGGFDAVTGLSPAAVSHGISLALRSTAFGLAVAIVAVVFAHFFRRATVKRLGALEDFSEALLSIRER